MATGFNVVGQEVAIRKGADSAGTAKSLEVRDEIATARSSAVARFSTEITFEEDRARH